MPFIDTQKPITSKRKIMNQTKKIFVYQVVGYPQLLWVGNVTKVVLKLHKSLHSMKNS